MHEVGSKQAETVAAVKAKFEHFAKMRGGETTGSLSLQIYTLPSQVLRLLESSRLLSRMLVADGNLDGLVEKAISGVCLHFIRTICMIQKRTKCLMLNKGTLCTSK